MFSYATINDVNCPCVQCRAPVSKDEAKGQMSGREAAADRVQRRAAVPAEEGVQREPVPDGAQAPGAGQRAGAERGADKDMVPEQAGQDQEVERLEEPAGAAAHGARAVQPHHGGHVRRRDGRPAGRHVVVIIFVESPTFPKPVAPSSAWRV